MADKRVQQSFDDLMRFAKVHERLVEEHKMLQTFLEETVQPRMRFLLSRFHEADQIAIAARQGFVKTPSFMPDMSVVYLDAVRLLVVRAVYSIWDREMRPTKDRHEVIPQVQAYVKQLKARGRWPKKWNVPGIHTIIRRLNETADIRARGAWSDESSRVYEGKTPCIAIRAGRYMPNPQLFEEPTRSQIKLLGEAWLRRRG